MCLLTKKVKARQTYFLLSADFLMFFYYYYYSEFIGGKLFFNFALVSKKYGKQYY